MLIAFNISKVSLSTWGGTGHKQAAAAAAGVNTRVYACCNSRVLQQANLQQAAINRT